MSHVDTSSPITHISLCAGYGGIDLGLKRAIPNLRTVAFSEIEAFAIANLVSKMEAGLLDCAPIWSDLKTFPWEGFLGKVDILSGGFPCQPFSAAGKREGDEDPRHLFPYILEGIGRCRPSIVFLENVEGILSAKLNGDNWRDPAGTPVLLHVLRELERVGYKAEAGIFSASEVGAPHRRKRVFIMAYNNSQRVQELAGKIAVKSYPPPLGTSVLLADYPSNGSPTRIPRQEQGHEGSTGISDHHSGQVWPSRPRQPQFSWEPPRVVSSASAVVGNSDGKGQQIRKRECESGIQRANSSSRETAVGQTQPQVGGNPDGTPCGMGYAELSVSCDNRTDELRLLGNGVVPATAEIAFKTLWNELNQ